MNAISETPAPQQEIELAPVNTYDARALVQDRAFARIRLDDQSYVLRITRAEKLILTK